MECKKWSAKGKCRKASADKEPTTDPNTLGGKRPRADIYGLPPLPRTSHFVFVVMVLWCCVLVYSWVWACGFVGLCFVGVWVCGCVGLRVLWFYGSEGFWMFGCASLCLCLCMVLRVRMFSCGSVSVCVTLCL